MSFFKIVPRDEGFLNDYSNAISLRVVKNNGIDTTPKINIKVTDLNEGYEQVVNNSGKGIRFKIKVVIKKTDIVRGVPLTDLLDGYIRDMTPLLISTDAIDIPDTGQYLIINNNNRSQTDTMNTIWELEFMTYTPLNLYKYKNDNSKVLEAINKSLQKQKSKSTKKSSVKYMKLKKCGYKVLVYSKKKKVVACVKTLQEILKKERCYSGKIDGWFGSSTTAAVKQYQRNYNKRHTVNNAGSSNNGVIFKVTAGTLISGKTAKVTSKQNTAKITKKLPVNGKVDKATWTALYKGE